MCCYAPNCFFWLFFFLIGKVLICQDLFSFTWNCRFDFCKKDRETAKNMKLVVSGIVNEEILGLFLKKKKITTSKLHMSEF